MRKAGLWILLAVVLLLSSISVSAGENEYDAEMQKALDLIKITWREEAAKNPELMPPPSVEIKNTRIVKLTKERINPYSGEKIEGLDGIEYIIEFMMLTNYFGDAYPVNAGVYDTVAVYPLGLMKVQQSNRINMVRARYFLNDLSCVVEEIIDLGDAYNGQLFES